MIFRKYNSLFLVILFFLITGVEHSQAVEFDVKFDKFKNEGEISSGYFHIPADRKEVIVEGEYSFHWGRKAKHEPIRLHIYIDNGPFNFTEAFDEYATDLDANFSISEYKDGSKYETFYLFLEKSDLHLMSKEDYSIKLYGDIDVIISVPRRITRKLESLVKRYSQEAN